MREFLPLTLAALALLSTVRAQEPAPPGAKLPGVQITFLPPPMAGTVSLGVFSKGGKLVRTLKREANMEKDFVVGLNGLITQWDGKDNAGRPAPPGDYAVHGFCVGPIEVSGEAFHGNDWIEEDDAAHPGEILDLAVLPNDRLAISARLADDSTIQLECGLKGEVKRAKEPADFQPAKEEAIKSLPAGKVGIQDGKIVPAGDGAAPLPEVHQLVDYSFGKAGTVWVIDRSQSRVEVQQYSPRGEFLRRLSVTPSEPAPLKIAASSTSDLIFLLENGEGVQRVRGLLLETLKAPLPDADPSPEGAAPKSSTWRIVFTKTIRASSDLPKGLDLLGRPARPKPEAKIAVKLLSNPLVQEAAGTVEITVEREPLGSFLYASDGLPLCRVTDTPGLKWAALVKEPKALSLVQSDGAVVEEYRLGKLGNMMAFDAGEYELK